MAKLTSTDIYGSLLVQGTLTTGTLSTTGTFVAPLGTALLPSYTFSGDLNTGIWSSGADTLNFSTNGAERLRIDPIGNLYVGETTGLGAQTARGLFIQSGSYVANGQVTQLLGKWMSHADDNNGRSGVGIEYYRVPRGGGVQTGTEIRFYTGFTYTPNTTAERMRIDQNGNIGINTTSPSDRLDVRGNIRITNPTTTTALNLNSISGQSTQVRFEENSSLKSAITYVAATSKLIFNNAGDRLTIQNDGNVGIGTTSPSSKLQVNGAIKISDTNDLNIGYFDTVENGFVNLNYNNHADTLLGVNMKLNSDHDIQTINAHGQLRGSAIVFGGNGHNNGANSINFYSKPSAIATAGTIYTANSAEMVLKQANLGIGTTTPTGTLTAFKATTGLIGATNNATIALSSSAVLNNHSTLTFGFQPAGTYAPAHFSFVTTNATGNTKGDFLFATRDLTTDSSPIERLRITSGGNVGIGTTSPVEKLEVAGSIIIPNGSQYRSKLANGTNRVLLGANSDNTVTIGDGSTGWTSLRFFPGSSEAMRINANGNVGIGTTTPAVRLDVLGQARITSASNSNHGLRLEASNEFLNDVNSPGIFTSAGGTSTYTPFSSAGGHLILEGRKSAIRDIYFKVGDTTTPQHVMTGAGNVGIGTTTPANTLHVESNSSVPTVFFKQNAAWNNSNFALSVEGYTNLNGFRINAADGVRGLYKITSGGTLGFATIGSDTPITFTQSATEERMRIAIGGNVGIGTTTPGEKLEIAGNIRFTNAADRTFNVASTAAGTAGRALSILSGSTTAGTANIAGGNVNIRSGQSTGSGTSSIVFQTPTPGDEGETTLNALADRMILNSNGVSILGNLTIDGTTTTVNSTTVTLDDPILTLGGDTAPTVDDSKDRGIEFRYFDTAARLGFFGYDRSINSFTGFRLATNTNEVFSGTLMDARFNSFVGSLGAAGTPAFTFTGDTNTGIWSSGADTLNISTAGAERLRVTSTGNVGIGTATPGSKLEVFGGVNIGGTGNVADASLHIKQSYGGFDRLTQIQPIGNSKPALNLMSSTNSSGANQWWSWGVNNDIFTLQPGTAFSGSTGMFINRSGNVGIGTTSPSSRLTIESSTPTSGDATLNIRTTPGNITAGSTVIGNIYFSTRDTSGGGTGDVARIAVIAGDGSSAYTGAGRPADLAFYTQPLGAGATLVESMRIDQDGNVGIGTTTPSVKLDIEKNASDANPILRLFNKASGAGSGISLIGDDGNDNALIWLNGTTNSLMFQTNTTTYNETKTAITINSSQNVGIGTTTPAEKLQVIGKTYLSGGSAAWNETTPGTARGTLHLGEASSTANFGSAITFGARDTSSGTNAQAGIYTRTDGTYGTKMYLATTGSYSAGSITRLMIDSNGRIGIGNTAPGRLLDVNGASRFRDAMNFGVSDNEGLISWASSRFLIRGQSGRGLSLGSNGTSDRMIITTTGDVGIGTTSPGAKLEVAGNTKTQDLIISDTSNVAKATMTYDSTSKSVKFVFA
jgi:hypothetical protein